MVNIDLNTVIDNLKSKFSQSEFAILSHMLLRVYAI